MLSEEKVNILLVDDHPENLLAIGAILETPSYNLVKAHSGEEALKYVLYQDFALILMDVQMPEMDGFEAAAMIRGRKRSRYTPIIFLTAIDKSQHHVAIGYELGAVDYLFKPVIPEILQSKVAVFVELFQKTQEIKQQAAKLAIVNQQLAEEINQRQQAKASLKEKEVLLQEIHHRVKNNLQIINSLLNLQSQSIKEPSVLNLFSESQNRIRSMALIHEKLYQSQDFSKVNLPEYICDLAMSLFRSYHIHSDITLKTEIVNNILLDIDRAVPCGLIINELITNSLKHAFPRNQKGEICIKAKWTEAQGLLLIISDSGVGLPADFELSKVTTLGLKLVYSLIAQLGGTIEIDRGEGTEFKITLPLALKKENC